jgi:predicted ATPase
MARGGFATSSREAGRFVREIELTGEAPGVGYPFDLPVVAGLRRAGRLELGSAVTFLVGDNGTGKSTLVEAVAVAAGFNPEGGSRSFNFSTRASHSALGDHLRIIRGAERERTSFFLRAETFYNVATEIERLEDVDPGLIDAYGGRTLHDRSHGESFLDLMRNRFGPRGLYLMDEPEAALAPRGLMAAVRLIHESASAGSQFLIATHSPILLAVPDATIIQIDPDGSFARVDYDDAEPVALTRAFLGSPERMLGHLLADD